jgi:hypothetical protein
MSRPQRDLVRPTRSTSAISSWRLAPIDRYALQWVIQGTWVFDSRLDSNVLKHGLARLLEHYPMLCGRVTAGMRIAWSETGIPFTEATDTTLGVADFDATRVDVSRFAHRFSPALIRIGAAPLMTVMLTQLRDGCVLAIRCSHACLDGNGFYSMARNLSRAAAGSEFALPSFDRRSDPMKSRSRADVARAARQAGWHRVTALDFARYALARPRLLDRGFVAHLSPSALQRCRETLARGSGCERLSTNSALLAHVGYCVARLLHLADRDSFVVSVAVDQRGRLASVPEDFAGNAVSVVATEPIPAGADRKDIAARLHERLEPMIARPSPALESIARLTTEVVGHRLAYSPIAGSSVLRRRALFYTNSFSKFPVYDLDFGSAARPLRPIRAVPHNLGDPIVVWPAPPAVGGLELYFSGALARRVERVDKTDPWWAELQRFND